MIVLLAGCFFCIVIPLLVFLSNLRLFRAAPKMRIPGTPAISVLIPARDEEQSIEASVRAVLASEGIHLECIVLDDESSDDTASIVRRLAAEDRRVRLETAPPLPAGWCGKQHACWILSKYSSHGVLCFLDADVRLAPDALARMTALLDTDDAALISGFPCQEVKTWMEQLLIPLIHFILLSFLPLRRMRQSTSPAYSAGCGQLMMARRDAYEAAGGHHAIRGSLHDGIHLPRAFRQAGFQTDVFDATDIGICRMYRNAGEVWRGLAKNATDGIAAPSRIVPFTAILLLGQVVPFLLWPTAPLLIVLALVSWTPRVIAARRFGQPLASALLHPAGIVVLLGIQWWALGKKLLGRPAGWKNRAYA